MTVELNSGNEGKFAIVRDEKEFSERIGQLRNIREIFNIHGHYGEIGRTRSSKNQHHHNILTARIDALRWLQGEDTKII